MNSGVERLAIWILAPVFMSTAEEATLPVGFQVALSIVSTLVAAPGGLAAGRARVLRCAQAHLHVGQADVVIEVALEMSTGCRSNGSAASVVL